MRLEQQQFDQYRLVSLLNRGGMGEVYLAEDARLDRHVAIKVIRTDTIQYDDEDEAKEASRLFLREARVIAKLDHPHILPLYDVGEQYLENMRLLYMVMPLRHDGSFADWLHTHSRRGEALAPKIVERVVRQAASALQYAHEHGIVHQDVKPSNFLIRGKAEHSSQFDVQLTDFGVAKLLTTTGESLVMRGTPSYMAPEQWEGRASPASDQYALAIMAYELLTGQVAFANGNHQQMWYQHTHVMPEPPSVLNPDLPVELDDVLLRALSKSPAERYDSIAEFALALRQAMLNNRHTQQAVAWSDSSHISQARIRPQLSNPSPSLPSSPPPPRHSISIKTVLFTALACILISTGVLTFLSIFGNPFVGTNSPGSPIVHAPTGTQSSRTSPSTTATHNTDLTATAQSNATAQAQGTVNAQNTATAITQATAIAESHATATATAQATATSSAYNNLAGNFTFDDHMQSNSGTPQWDSNYSSGVGGCEFTNGAYLSSIAQSQIGTFSSCYAQPTSYSNFFYQLHLHIVDGDQGGILFRGNSNNGAFYYFHIDTNGNYGHDIYQNNIQSGTLISGSSPYITTGYGKDNLLAVQATGNTFTLYVNKHLLKTVTDSSNTFSQGQIGVVAASVTQVTDVVFTEVILSVK